MKKYNEVIQRYYVQYLAGYDAVYLSQLIQVSVLCKALIFLIVCSLANWSKRLTLDLAILKTPKMGHIFMVEKFLESECGDGA